MLSSNIIEVKEATPQLIQEVNNLLAQLSTRKPQIDVTILQQIIDSPDTHLYIYYKEGKSAGMLTLASYLAPTGRKWWIEDVVVDERYRGCGIGQALVENAALEAHNHGGGSLLLTSRPSREAANRLYQRAGFEKRETNVYKKTVE
jgi:ribosomal protein S18 acetylase RimI-like enzyme